MDWSRAKSIIIMLLLTFNIFMLVNIIVYAKGQGIPRETIQNTIDILKSRGVELECGIPTYKSAPKLIYRNSELDEGLIAERLLGTNNSGSLSGTYSDGSRKLSFESSGIMLYEDSKPLANIAVSNRNETEKYVRNFVKDTGLIDDSYVLDKVKSDKDGSVSLYFIEKYKGYLIFDNYLKARVTESGITSIEAGRKEIQGLSQDKASDMAAAYQVLLGNFDEGKRTVITDIDFGFFNANAAQANGAESFEQFPVWRIEIAGSDIPRYFSTSDGKEIKFK
jgi:regulatory protein YycI of two-component signal transduction system YycFG